MCLENFRKLCTWGDNLVGEKKMRSYWLPKKVCGSLDGVKIVKYLTLLVGNWTQELCQHLDNSLLMEMELLVFLVMEISKVWLT